MAFLDNNPTFTYVKCSNLSIIYDGMSYNIQNMYTNCKYLYWDLNTPNVLVETNIRPTESASKFLVCINDNGIHTEVPHDELIYNFGIYSPGEISQGEFNSLKVKVNNNETKYNSLSRTVDGVTEIIGKEEVLENGSIITNLNTVKKTASDLTARIEQISVEYGDGFKEIRNKVSDRLVSLLTSISVMNSDFGAYSNDGELEIEEKNQLTTDISAISNSLANLTDVIAEVTTLLNANNQDTYIEKLNKSMENVNTSVNALISFATTAISDSTISSSEVTLVTQSVGNSSKYINVLKADCDEIMLLGLGGTIYDQFAQLKLLNDRFQTTVKEIKYSTSNSLSSERSKAYVQIEDLISVIDGFYTLINSLSTTSNLSAVEISTITASMTKITNEYNELMTLSRVYEVSDLLSDIEKQSFVDKGIVVTNKYNTLITSTNSMLTDSYMNSSEKNTILNNIKLLLDAVGVYNNDLSEVILLVESYKFTSQIEKTKGELNESIKTLNGSISGLVDFTNETFANNVVDQIELKNLKNDLAKLVKEKKEIDNIYTSIKTLSTDNADFTNAYNDLITEYNLITNIMKKYTQTGIIPTSEDENNINIGYNNISKKLESFIKSGYEVNKAGVVELNSSIYSSYTNSKDILISSLNDFSNNCLNLFQNYYLTTEEQEMFNALFEKSNSSIQEYISKINNYIRDIFVSDIINQDISNYYVASYNEITDAAFSWKEVCELLIDKNFIVGEDEINNIQNKKDLIELKFAKFNTLNMTLCSNLIYDFIESYDILLKLYTNLYTLNSDTGIISSEIDNTLITSMDTTKVVNNYTNFINTHMTGLENIHNSYISKYSEITTIVNDIVNNTGGDIDSYTVVLNDLLNIIQSYINAILGYIYNNDLSLEQLNIWTNDLYALQTDIESQAYSSMTYIKTLYTNVIYSFTYITTSDSTLLTTNLTDINTNPIIWLNSKVLSHENISSLNISNFKTNCTNLKTNMASIYDLFGNGDDTNINKVIGKYNQLLTEINNVINTETSDVIKNKYILRKEEYQEWYTNAITDRDSFYELIDNYTILLDEFLSLIDSIYVEGTYLSENSYLNYSTNKFKFSENISNVSKITGDMINTISKYLEYSNRNLLDIETMSLQSVINISKINMEDIFIDSYLSDSEKILMTQNLKKVETDKVNLESAYLSLMNNKYIVDENRNNLAKSYEFYCQQYLNVVDIINSFLVKTTMMVTSDNDALNQTMNNYNEAISNFNTIKDIAISQAYKNEAEKYSEKSIESNMIQLSNSFNFTFDNVEKKVMSENDKLVETLTKFQTYVKIIQGEDNKPHVILGKTGNSDDAQFKIDISNEKMSFLQNDVEVAYVKYDKFRITNGEILDSLKIGSFAFEPDFDGGVAFKFKGGE